MSRIEGRKAESGAALIMTIVLLVLMGLIGLAAMETVTRDRQVAGFQTQSRMALYAAEAGLSDAKERLTTDPNAYDQTAVIPFPNCVAPIPISDAPTYAAPYLGQPSYCGDPTIGATPPIQYVGTQQVSINMDQTLPQEVYWLFRIRVQGQGAAIGQVERLDTVAGAFRLE